MKYILWSLLFLLFLGACQKPEQTQVKQKLKAITVQEAEVPIKRDFVGQVYGKADIPIRARVDGFIEKIHFDEGVPVKKGQLLYSIDDYPFRLDVTREESRLAESRVNLVNAKNDLNRIEPLAAINAVSQRELDAAVARKEAAEEAVKAAEANLSISKVNRGYAQIYSPISGLIGKSKATVGEYVGRAPNPVILNTVSQIDSVIVEFFLSERDYLTFAREFLADERRDLKRIDTPLELLLADGQIFPYQGKVKFIDRNVDPSTGSILVQSIFPNPRGLIRPGQFARVRSIVNIKENAILIPQRAVFELQGFFNVFVVDASNTLVQRQVQIFDTYQDMFIINSGLEKGETILIEGLMTSRAGQEIEVEITTYMTQNTP